MLAVKSRTLIFFSLGVLILFGAWCLQEKLFLNWDVSWLMHAAERLLGGGSYSDSFFETNPPLILFLYLPPVLLTQALGISPVLSFRIYIFVLAFISLWLSACLAKPLFNKQEVLLAPAFILALELVFLILPLHELGQRDHLMLVLTMPYLLAFACRLQGRSLPLFKGGAILVGLMAALGYGLKPHFLLIPTLLEWYGLWKTGHLRLALRPENLTLLALLLVYLISIILFFPDYLSFIVPFSLRHYYDGITSSWLNLLSQPILIISLLPIILVLLFHAKNKHQALSAVLWLALVGAALSYIMQRTVFYYHLVPIFSLTLLLLMLLYVDLVQEGAKSKLELCFAFLLGLFMFYQPLVQGLKIYHSWSSHKVNLSPLIGFIQKQAPHQAIYFFSSTTVYTFPTIDYAEAKLASRIPFMWMVSGLVNEESSKGELSAAAEADKLTLGNMIAEDFAKEKPVLVFVDDGEPKPYIHKEGFDYLRYFSANKVFEKEWQNYVYMTTLKQEGLYLLKVYKRKSS